MLTATPEPLTPPLPSIFDHFPRPATQPVTTVRAAGRLDRNAGFAEDADVAAGRPLGDAEPLGELIGRRARAGLQDLQYAQRSGGGAGEDVWHIAILNRKRIVRIWPYRGDP